MQHSRMRFVSERNLHPLNVQHGRHVEPIPGYFTARLAVEIRLKLLASSLLCSQMKLNKLIPFSLAALGLLAIGAQARAEDPPADVMKQGKASYATCMACHNVDGKGLPVGTLMMAPPLAGSKFALGDPEVMALAILKGIVKDPADTTYVGIMAPLEAALDDKKLAAVMTYVRNSFGNKAPTVTEEQAKGYREKFKKIKNSVKRSTLDKLLAKKEAAAKAK